MSPVVFSFLFFGVLVCLYQRHFFLPIISPLAQRSPINPMMLVMFLLGSTLLHLLPFPVLAGLLLCVGFPFVITLFSLTDEMLLGLCIGVFAEISAILPIPGMPETVGLSLPLGVLYGAVLVTALLFLKPASPTARSAS